MLDGMKMATEGMMTMSVKQDIITNNLANVGTAGFRKESLVVSSFSDVLNRELGMDGMTQTSGEALTTGGLEKKGTLGSRTVTHSAQGALKETGNPFDLALDDNGKGFFTIQTPEGIKFTRAGTFHLSTDGYLVTADGSFLLGHRGPIKVQGTDFKVSSDGVVNVDGKPIDKLLVSTFEDGNMMKKAGDANFVAPDGGVKATTRFAVKQGYVEMANVNAIQEMVDLMMVMRNFEANQKALQSHDQRLQKAANELGKVR
ncbi:MAG: flagellar hook-basal body protein [Candidatus Eremiobacterota bacterium]